MSAVEYELTDRITKDHGTVFLTGVQALARLPIEQLRVDRAAGLNTAALASGYPGSPLAGLDGEFARAAATQPDLPVVLRPALNEELGVAAVMGSQLAATRADAKYDGVIGLWYGKAPGLDRASDALRHAVFTGTSPHGGAVAIVGDDPGAKSSTLPSSSDATFVDLHLPILYPGDAAQALDLGRHAIALSRASGLWVGLKIEASVADGSGTVSLDPHRVSPVMPTIDGERYECRPDGLLLGAHSLEIERELRGTRLELAVQYDDLNGLNRLTVDAPNAWLGIIASGVTHRELMEALRRLGLDHDTLAECGVKILEMQMPIPFSPDVVREFSRGLEEVMVVEEMNPTLARLVRDCLYSQADRPFVTGKQNRDGAPQFPDHGALVADRMVEPLRAALSHRIGDRLTSADQPRERQLIPLTAARTPYFCSGCPHNHSTKTPEGTVVGAGIGCHTMALLSDDPRLGDIVTISAMGGEGAPWIGMAPFVDTPHLVQNLGDGTYFHSGQLAVQASIAAGVDVTYKILLNGHVAMTGGQLPPGQLDAGSLANILLTQGVSRVIITTDDASRLEDLDIPRSVEVWDRHRIIEAQEALATIPGVTVLIHDQPCAAQLRRDRHRGKIESPELRVMINERVCEGCGDCSEKSSCLSVQPVETEFGRKTRIDQASCNLDYSCIDGDCPSFISVRPAARRWWHRFLRSSGRDTGASTTPAHTPDPGPIPQPNPTSQTTTAIRMAGIGGTGVVTAAQIIGTAAMLDGLDVNGLDQTGLSQKAGPVLSDLFISRHADAHATNHLGDGQADALLAFDTVAAASEHTLAATDRNSTMLIGSTTQVPTATMVTDPSRAVDDPAVIRQRIESTCHPGAIWADATAAVTTLVREPATANLFVIGMAVQAGAIPVSVGSLHTALELNGVAVESNRSAFEWGRLAVADPLRFASELRAARPALTPHSAELPAVANAALDELAALGIPDDVVATARLRAADLVDYQDAALSQRYLDRTVTSARAERAADPASSELTATIIEQYYRVLAYKDEYEVARLLTDDAALATAAATIDGPAKLSWNLHPPILRDRGLGHKIEIGTWARPAMRFLARRKGLRGTAFDPFGPTTVRRAERQAIADYEAALDTALGDLTSPEQLPTAIAIAAAPELIRGYERRKLAGIDAFHERLAELAN